jgi:hypothetical protein
MGLQRFPLLHLFREQVHAPGIWYAYVIDRFMVNTIKVTMFGTTAYRDDETGNYFFLTVDPGTTDLLRESVGLPRVGRNGW